MEPYAANLKTQNKNTRKRPVHRNGATQIIHPQENIAQNVENIPQNVENLAKKSKNTYYDETAAEKLEKSVQSVAKMLRTLRNLNLSDEVKLDTSQFDSVINDLLEVKESLNKPVIKEVLLHPQALVSDDHDIDFIPPSNSKPSINAANCKPEEDLINFELEEINREKIIPRVALGHLNVYKQKQDNTVSLRAAYWCSAPIEEARPIKDDFYQPILESVEEEKGKIKIYQFLMGFDEL